MSKRTAKVYPKAYIPNNTFYLLAICYIIVFYKCKKKKHKDKLGIKLSIKRKTAKESGLNS